MAITLDDVQEIAGGEYRGKGYLHLNCPYHNDEHASLVLYPDGWFHCLANCESGRIEWLYEKLTGESNTQTSFKRSKSLKGRPPKLPRNAGSLEDLVESAHERMLPDTSMYRMYAEARGIDSMIPACKLGWYQGWLTIPIYGKEGNFNGLILRAGPQAQEETGLRFTQPTGQQSMAYSPSWDICRSAESIFIPFGLVDAISIGSLGFPAITTTGGAKSFRPEWFDEYRVRLYAIPDEGEDSQAYRLAKKLGWRGKVVRLAFPDGHKDINDLLVSGQVHILESLLKKPHG
jgi:hypothetical protein